MKKFLFFFIFATICCVSIPIFGNPVEEKKRVVFIVNPISHQIKNLNLGKLIAKNLDLDQFEYKIVYTQYPQHATQLAHDAVMDSADIVAAVGGDGTINEVGIALINTHATLAIIPVGSGNGLARHLGIPIRFAQAVQVLNDASVFTMDTAKINDRAFLGIAGIGFDAHIAKQFASFGKRGLFSYCQVALREFGKYKSETYSITVDGKPLTRKAFILSFANSSQYGNDFIIAPKARIDDGYLDLIIVEDIPWYSIPQFIYQCKQGTLNRSHHFTTDRFKELTIQHPHMQAHIDGEPLEFHDCIKVTVVPKSLKVMVPNAKQ